MDYYYLILSSCNCLYSQKQSQGQLCKALKSNSFVSMYYKQLLKCSCTASEINSELPGLTKCRIPQGTTHVSKRERLRKFWFNQNLLLFFTSLCVFKL
jgi:hypothetical protein